MRFYCFLSLSCLLQTACDKVSHKRGRKVTYNGEAISQYISRYAGFQVLLSNGIKDPLEALQIYRDKDHEEKNLLTDIRAKFLITL